MKMMGSMGTSRQAGLWGHEGEQVCRDTGVWADLHWPQGDEVCRHQGNGICGATKVTRATGTPWWPVCRPEHAGGTVALGHMSKCGSGKQWPALPGRHAGSWA